jgi:hypothetical protein
MSALGGTAKLSAKRSEEFAFYWILPHVPDARKLARFGALLS